MQPLHRMTFLRPPFGLYVTSVWPGSLSDHYTTTVQPLCNFCATIAWWNVGCNHYFRQQSFFLPWVYIVCLVLFKLVDTIWTLFFIYGHCGIEVAKCRQRPSPHLHRYFLGSISGHASKRFMPSLPKILSLMYPRIIYQIPYVDMFIYLVHISFA